MARKPKAAAPAVLKPRAVQPLGAVPGAWPADHVERRPIGSLMPSARNARTHSPGQLAQLAESIRQWGWTIPVLVDEAGSIIAGHGRTQAAQLLGIKEVPVMVARGWSEGQKRAYMLADNQLALNAGWDRELLAGELAELQLDGLDLELTGFADDVIADLLGSGDVLEVGGVGDGTKLTKTSIKWGKKSEAPLTEDEASALDAAFDAHFRRTGVAFGFVRSLLEGANPRA